MENNEFTAIKIFEKYSFSREDAEALLESIKEAKSEDLASKMDILKIEKKITEIEKKITEIEKDIRLLDVKIESSKNTLIVWMISIMFAMAGLIIGVLKFT